MGNVLPVLLTPALPRMGLERASTASQVRVAEVLPLERIDTGRAVCEASQREPWGKTGNVIGSAPRDVKNDG